ncbi:MAG: FlgD immunoglobulin-like domain containing protein [Candidatus Krumholzibacteria bacterium]|nr:FlgD immunoglobulin-like domain containing protein [Candidatus Krumholzibacteria bacterium]
MMAVSVRVIPLLLAAAAWTAAPADAADGWQPEVRLTADPGVSMPPPNNGRWIAVDSAGRVHVVFKDDRDRDFDIYHKVRSGGIWLDEQRVYDSGGDSERPVVAADGLGRVHLVWNDLQDDNKEIYHAIWNGSWNLPWRVTETGGDSFASSTVVAGDIVHLVHMETIGGFYEIVYRAFDVLAWSDPVQLTDAGSGERMVPSIAAGPDGTLHAVWFDVPPGGHGRVIWRSCAAGSWSDPEEVSGPEANAFRPTAAVDGEGGVHVVWIDKRSGWEQIYYRRRGPEGWGPETLVTAGEYTHYHPSIVAAADTVTLIYWAAWPSAETAGVFARTLEGDGWSARSRISGSASKASLCCLSGEADGRLHAAWVDERHGDFEIYYAEYLPPGTGIGEHEEEQDPALPRAPLSLAVAPNPFAGSARITLAVASGGPVSLSIYDAAGRLVRRVAAGTFAGGSHLLEWDGRDEAGRSAPPGVYFARARAGKQFAAAKIVMTR